MVTNEQVNAVLARSGLSMEGFESFRKGSMVSTSRRKNNGCKISKLAHTVPGMANVSINIMDTTRKNKLCVKAMY